MKGGATLHKLTGTRLSFTVIILLITIVIICFWERNPLFTSFLSSDQFKSIPKDFTDQQKSNPGSIFPSKIPDNTSETPYIDPNEGIDEGEDDEVRENDSKDCNYAKGKWVPDSRRPFYSGKECKRWLSEMWACQLQRQRTDFSFEKFRWQPHNCQMPSFTGTRFLKRMRHKTLAFVGDSLGRQQFQSIMCMITGGKPDPQVQDVGPEFGLVKARGALRPDGWAYRFPKTNTTVLFYWSASLCELQPVFNGSDHKPVSFALHLDRPVSFLTKYLHRFHVLVLNTGHHWNRGKFAGNHWELHAYGKPVSSNNKLSDLSNAKNLTLHSIISWVDSQIVEKINPNNLKVFLRTLSPRHFVNGDWNTGGSCDNTVPLRGGSEVSVEKSTDTVAELAVNGSRVGLLDITALSQLRDECHISKYGKASNGAYDCLHWCLPGVPDTWNEILFARI